MQLDKYTDIPVAVFDGDDVVVCSKTNDDVSWQINASISRHVVQYNWHWTAVCHLQYTVYIHSVL